MEGFISSGVRTTNSSSRWLDVPVGGRVGIDVGGVTMDLERPVLAAVAAGLSFSLSAFALSAAFCTAACETEPARQDSCMV